jgi:hypothetical protein
MLKVLDSIAFFSRRGLVIKLALAMCSSPGRDGERHYENIGFGATSGGERFDVGVTREHPQGWDD